LLLGIAWAFPGSVLTFPGVIMLLGTARAFPGSVLTFPGALLLLGASTALPAGIAKPWGRFRTFHAAKGEISRDSRQARTFYPSILIGKAMKSPGKVLPI
jgi:hypothetical protein